MSPRDAQSAYEDAIDEVDTTVDELIEKHGSMDGAK